MIDQRTVFEIHRLHHEGFSTGRIASILALDRKTVSKYLLTPNPSRATTPRPSRLDPFKDEIRSLLSQAPHASAQVIFQRLLSLGFHGSYTIVKDFVRTLRQTQPTPCIRFESPPGEQCQIDWGHFGSLSYENWHRKLYCLAVVECHSRMLYLEFSHSQRQETLHRCLLNAFVFFGGTPKELVFDNMATAVTEREGSIIRYNEAFLSFLRPFKISPRACNVRRPNEKGKVEKGAIHYIRHNFWPLKNFMDLDDVNRQAFQWRDSIANVRLHSTTGQRPCERFKPEALNPLVHPLPDCRDTSTLTVHSDFSILFDGNWYSVPPWAIQKQVTAKADPHTLTVYFNEKPIATHKRSWERKQRIELPDHREAALKHSSKYWSSSEAAAFMSLGEEARSYLEKLAHTRHPLKKSLLRLLELKEEYGTQGLLEAIRHANAYQAFGVEYIENILFQKMTPQRNHPPVRLKQEAFNSIRLDEPSLADYDALVLKRRHSHD